MERLARSASLTGFADLARARGLDPIALARACGVDPRALDGPDLPVPASRIARLLEEAARRAGDPAFGLRLADTRRLSNLGLIGLLIREEPTIGAAITSLIRYVRLQNEALRCAIERREAITILTVTPIAAPGAAPAIDWGPGAGSRQGVDLAIGVLVRVLRQFLGEGWQPELVSFVHGPPADRREHRRLLRCPIDFSADANAVVCLTRDLDRPIPTADPISARELRRLAEARLAAEGEGQALRARQVIDALLALGACSADRVAKHFGVTRRTLTRHLAAEGTSFQALLDEARSDLVRARLDHPAANGADLAASLGFSSPSGVARWFRARFGRTLGDERRARLEAGGP